MQDIRLGADPTDLVHKMPHEWEAPLVAAGWTYAASNQGIVFWDKPGYWLRLSCYEGAWWATVMPEDYCVGFKGGEYAESEKAKPYLGRGAKLRALQGAAALWRELEAYLAPLGIRLDCVGVRRHRSTGGHGSSLGTVAYRYVELAPLLEALNRSD